MSHKNDLDNHANQLNPNNKAYWLSRIGNDKVLNRSAAQSAPELQETTAGGTDKAEVKKVPSPPNWPSKKPGKLSGERRKNNPPKR